MKVNKRSGKKHKIAEEQDGIVITGNVAVRCIMYM